MPSCIRLLLLRSVAAFLAGLKPGHYIETLLVFTAGKRRQDRRAPKIRPKLFVTLC
jgi:hypothetical protein